MAQIWKNLSLFHTGEVSALGTTVPVFITGVVNPMVLRWTLLNFILIWLCLPVCPGSYLCFALHSLPFDMVIHLINPSWPQASLFTSGAKMKFPLLEFCLFRRAQEKVELRFKN